MARLISLNIYAVLLSTFVCTFVLFTNDSLAQGLTPLPELKTLDIEQFVDETEIVNKVFEDDEFLSFQYQIHKDWKENDFINLKNVIRNGRLYGTIVEHAGPILGDIKPYFRVSAEEMDREISAKNWFINFVLNKGYTLKSLDVDEENNKFEAFYVSRRDLDSFAIRAVGQKIGPRVILAEYAVPGKNWADYADYQTLVIKSVSFSGSDSKNIEDREFYAYLDAVDFAYPDSWITQSEVIYAPNKMRVDVFNSTDGLNVLGKITVHTISGRSVKDLDDMRVYDIKLRDDLKDIQDSFKKEYNVHELLEKRTYNVPETVKFQMTDIYALEPIRTQYETNEEGEKSYELWFSVFLKGYRYHVVTMITTSRNRDSYTWAVNDGAYKIIVESLMRNRKVSPSDIE